MAKGTIVKGIGGFYYIDTGDCIIECKARGHFRNKKLSPCVGDKVEITVDYQTNKGTIDEIYQRTNCFVRPPVANIDELIVVASARNPEPDLTFIDKMLIIAHHSNVDVRLCFNKSDLDDTVVNKLVELYNKCGYNAFATSTFNNVGLELIKDVMEAKTIAFSGFSGVGKSSLLNAVIDNKVMETGEISERLKRGKHTTRHVELIKYKNGYIVDTPGFSMLDFPADITKDMLKDYFPDFSEYEGKCKFRDCNHLGNASVCAVADAVEKHLIFESRYNNYKMFYEILSQRKDWKK